MTRRGESLCERLEALGDVVGGYARGEGERKDAIRTSGGMARGRSAQAGHGGRSAQTDHGGRSAQAGHGGRFADIPHGHGETLNVSYPGVPDSVPRARHALEEFAAGAGATGERLEAVRLASSEALTNVVKHAYRPGPGPIHVIAAVACGELWVLVADDGRGLHAPSDSPGLGLGLAVIAEVSDDFAIVKRASGGTEVRMRFRLGTNKSPAGDHARGSLASASSPA